MSTLALNYFLVLRPRKAAGSTHVVLPTHNVFKRLALRAVETNLVSLAVHLTVVVLYAKHDAVYFWYSAPAFMLVKVYGISLLVTLNSRASDAFSLSRDGSGPRSDFNHFSHSGPSRIGASRHQARSGGVTFDFEQHVHVSEPGAQQRADESPVYTPHFSFGPTPALFPLADGSTVASSFAGGEGAREGRDPEKREVGVALGGGEGEALEMERFDSDKAKANMGWI